MRSCGSDDFGFYGQVAPALMMFVGFKDGPGTQDLPLHHPCFLPPDEAVEAVARAQAVALMAAAATRWRFPACSMLKSSGATEERTMNIVSQFESPLDYDKGTIASRGEVVRMVASPVLRLRNGEG